MGKNIGLMSAIIGTNARRQTTGVVFVFPSHSLSRLVQQTLESEETIRG
jgi:hypothetical protein